MARLQRLFVPLLALLAACRSFEVEREEVFLRYLPDVDVLDVVLVYDGVGATNDEEESIAKATRTLDSIAGGRRRFMFWDWPFDFDLDEIVAKLRAQPVDEGFAELARALLDYHERISVTEARLLKDPERRLCLLQRLRFEQGARALRLVDLGLNALVLQEAGEDPAEMTGDAATDALCFARARRGGGWARFDGAELMVSIPATPAYAARLLKDLVAAAVASGVAPEAAAQLVEPLSALTSSGDEVLLRFAPAEDGWIHFTLRDGGERGYRPAVAERLNASRAIETGELQAELQKLLARQ